MYIIHNCADEKKAIDHIAESIFNLIFGYNILKNGKLNSIKDRKKASNIIINNNIMYECFPNFYDVDIPEHLREPVMRKINDLISVFGEEKILIVKEMHEYCLKYDNVKINSINIFYVNVKKIDNAIIKYKHRFIYFRHMDFYFNIKNMSYISKNANFVYYDRYDLFELTENCNSKKLIFNDIANLNNIPTLFDRYKKYMNLISIINKYCDKNADVEICDPTDNYVYYTKSAYGSSIIPSKRISLSNDLLLVNPCNVDFYANKKREYYLDILKKEKLIKSKPVNLGKFNQLVENNNLNEENKKYYHNDENEIFDNNSSDDDIFDDDNSDNKNRNNSDNDSSDDDASGDDNKNDNSDIKNEDNSEDDSKNIIIDRPDIHKCFISNLPLFDVVVVVDIIARIKQSNILKKNIKPHDMIISETKTKYKVKRYKFYDKPYQILLSPYVPLFNIVSELNKIFIIKLYKSEIKTNLLDVINHYGNFNRTYVKLANALHPIRHNVTPVVIEKSIINKTISNIKNVFSKNFGKEKIGESNLINAYDIAPSFNIKNSTLPKIKYLVINKSVSYKPDYIKRLKSKNFIIIYVSR